jgi:soluble lytic murein transglycosylase
LIFIKCENRKIDLADSGCADRSTRVRRAAMRGIGVTLSRLPAARAFIAGAAFLAGTMAQVAHAQPMGHGEGDETAMAVPLMMLPGASGGVALPRPLSPSDAVLVRRIFIAQARGDLALAARETGKLENTLLLGSILADRYLGSSHRATAAELTEWLDHYGDQPDASAIHALLLRRLPKGAAAPPAPAMLALASAPISTDPQHDDNDDTDDVPIKRNVTLDRVVFAHANAGNDTAALRLIDQNKTLDPAYRALLRAEVARVLFTQNNDAGALDIAVATLHDTPADRRVALGGLVAGLAAWRRHETDLAATYFAIAANAPIASIAQRAAGAFWAARAERQIGDPVGAAYWLHKAAAYPDTFHGLIAQRALRLRSGVGEDRDTLSQADVDAVAAVEQGLRAFALLQVGQPDRAEAELRALWPITKTNPTLGRALRLVASGAGMVDLAAQLAALIETADGHARSDLALKLPPLHPTGGFRIDPALVYALTRLESDFDSGAVSPAGARGLMQIMPMTARFMTGNALLEGALLHNPAFNLALGQRYVAYLATQNGVDGDLIRMLASYNIGPTTFLRMDEAIHDNNDPLLFIEAIPNAETRTFVRRALTYAWIYATRLGRRPPGLDDLVGGEFPRFTGATPPGTLALGSPRIH